MKREEEKLDRRYKLKAKGSITATEELKQRLIAKTDKSKEIMVENSFRTPIFVL